MGPTLEKYIQAGMSLDADEREIAALAPQSVGDAEPSRVDGAWAEEVDRRLDEVLRGTVETVSGGEALNLARVRSSNELR